MVECIIVRGFGVNSIKGFMKTGSKEVYRNCSLLAQAVKKYNKIGSVGTGRKSNFFTGEYR